LIGVREDLRSGHIHPARHRTAYTSDVARMSAATCGSRTFRGQPRISLRSSGLRDSAKSNRIESVLGRCLAKRFMCMRRDLRDAPQPGHDGV
jgi:hypothetical protein